MLSDCACGDSDCEGSTLGGFLEQYLKTALEEALKSLGEQRTLDLIQETLSDHCVTVFGCGHMKDDCQCGEET